MRKDRLLFITVFLLSAVFCRAAGISDSSVRVRLRNGWMFLRSDVGSPWELIRPVQKGKPEEVPLWEKVSLPHTFNAEDAVEPDANYYEGPGWYKTVLDISNPYPSGRTVLEFAGSGQVTDVYVGMQKAGSHTGGYDKWSLDITEAVEAFRKTARAVSLCPSDATIAAMRNAYLPQCPTS